MQRLPFAGDHQHSHGSMLPPKAGANQPVDWPPEPHDEGTLLRLPHHTAVAGFHRSTREDARPGPCSEIPDVINDHITYCSGICLTQRSKEPVTMPTLT
jgi:hypothetical protein